jgi:uracil-DNA glycosylase family 4
MPVSPKARDPVLGHGPFPARVAIFGEAPGATENKKGYPFAGKSGYFLDLFLGPWGARLGRHHCYVSNVVKLWPGRGPDNKDLPPDDSDLLRDWQELHREIEEGGFDWIVAVGGISFRWLTGLDLPLSITHGMRYWLGEHLQPPGRAPIPVISTYHPAAGMHSPQMQGNCLWDFRRLGAWVRGEAKDYRGAARRADLSDYRFFTEDDIPSYQALYAEPGPVGYDTEGPPEAPWSLQWSPAEGVGFILRHPIPAEMRKWLLYHVFQLADPLVIHSNVWDMRLDDALLGYHPIYEARSWWDSQIAGYITCQESIQVGLKPTAQRHLGVKMLTYDDAIDSLREARSETIVYELYARGTELLPTQLTKSGKPKKKQQAATLTPLAKRLERIVLDAARDDKGEGSERWSYYKRLKAVARDFPGDIPDLPNPTLADVDDETFLAYAGADPDCTRGIYFPERDEIERMQLGPVLALDQGAVPMFSRMNQVGMMLDVEKMRALGERFEVQAAEQRQAIAAIADWDEFDPAKTQMLRWLLYDKLKMRCPVRTPTGDDSTNERALAILSQRYKTGERRECMDAILAWREARKHCGTYIYPVLERVRADGSVSPDLRLVNTATGRPAGLFVTFPAHTKDGAAIRGCFYPRPGCRFTSTDLSGIEMRVAAHYFREPRMIRLFQEGRDLHSETAARFFQRPVEYIEAEGRKTMREPIKRAGFGILYGIGAHGLMTTLTLPQPQGCDLHYTEEEGQHLIDWWYEQFPGVKDGQREIVAEARRFGYVRGVSGRIRYFPNVRSPDEYTRAEAIREMCNHPIQEGGQALMKRAMAILWEEYMPDWHAQGIYLEPMLQIHDDLVFEVEEEYAQDWTQIVAEAMVRAAEDQEYRVPIDSGSSTGSSWAALKG